MSSLSSIAAQIATLKTSYDQLTAAIQAIATQIAALESEVSAAATRKPTLADVRDLLNQIEPAA